MDNQIFCRSGTRRLKRLHAEILTMEKLAAPSFALAGLQWSRQHYFEDRIAQPIMCMFLVSTAAGITCLLIVLVSGNDTLRQRSSMYLPRRLREPTRSPTLTAVSPPLANKVPERIPRCYKLKELESDLESITRLELDDQDAGNHYVYGPWRVYCESRDGSVAK